MAEATATSKLTGRRIYSLNLAAKIRTALLVVLAVMILGITLLVLGTSEFNTPYQYELVQLDDGWTITRGNNVWQLDSVERSNIGIANKGDVLTLSRILPDSDLSPATIRYRSVLSSTKVFVDDEEIYSFGEKYIDLNWMLPKMINFVQLPRDYQGRKITIEITAQEDNAFSGLSPIYFGNYNDLKNNQLQTNRLAMVIGVYLCHLGFILLILSPFLAFADNHDFSIFMAAATAVFMGVYILAYNDIFWYLSDSPSFFTFVEYFSLYMIPASILGFIILSGQSIFKRTGIALLVINLIFAFSTSIMHLLRVVHICSFVSWLHTIGVCEGLFLIITLILAVRNIRKNEFEYKITISSTNTLIFGLILFLACAVIDIVKFNILKFSKFGEVNSHINFTTVGALIFIMCLLLHYFYHCIEYINESTVKVQLEGLAYTDALTDLANRSKCEQVLAELSGEYTIISLDLDYLKYTNDNYGHDQGDKLLNGFSDILKSSFTDASLLGRMGGDEFIVILPYVDEERTQRDIDCFTDLMNHKNSTETKLRFSASWGHASSKDKELKFGADAQHVYLLADQRMYSMKGLHHKQSLGRLYDDLLNKILDEGGKRS